MNTRDLCETRIAFYRTRYSMKTEIIIISLLLFLQNNLLGQTIELHPNKTYSITSSEKEPLVENASTIFYCNGIAYPLQDLEFVDKSVDKEVNHILGSGTQYNYQFRDVSKKYEFGVEICLYDTSNWVSINTWILNLSKDKIVFDCVEPLILPQGIKLGKNVYDQRILAENMEKLITLKDAKKNKQSVTSRSFIGIRDLNTNQEMTMGFSICQAWGSFVYDISQETPVFKTSVFMDVDVAPKEKRYGEALHFKKGNVLQDLETLITATGKEVNAITDAKSYGGWCSWYGFNYFIDNDITEDVVCIFANEASKKKELPFELMLLDDGYFTLPGDWTTLRPVFPNGMKYLTQQTEKNGLTPGLWCALSLVHENSDAFQKYPQWVDRNKDGSFHHHQQNWGRNCRSFDISNPDYLNYTDSLFRVLTHEWGFRYLKLDFNVEPGPNRFNRSITSFQAMRNWYKRIRKAVGDEVFLANCAGSPYGPVIGIAQAGRVGPDVNPSWESVIEGCRKSMLHIPFHHRWWTNDPDCLNMRMSSLTEEELQTHLTANFMGGGYILFSDSLSQLTPRRSDMLAAALPPAGTAATIIDYMTAPEIGIPSVLTLPISTKHESYNVVSVFNWGETPDNRTLSFESLQLDPQKKYHVYDFWSDKYQGALTKEYIINALQPHQCQLLAFRPVSEYPIQIISSTLHMLQGAREISNITQMNTSPFDSAKDEIWIEITPVSLRHGKLVLTGGDNLRIAALQGGKGKLSQRADKLWDLELKELQDKCVIVLRDR